MGNKNGSSNKRKIKNFSTETINIESNEDKKKRTPPNLENVKQEGNFDNIKSKYILKKIFDNLDKNKSLKIINYNTKLQKSLDINIKDNKEFYEIYSPIEIEIILIKNIYKDINCFIKHMDNIHIYFNNNKKEVNKFEFTKNENVEKIKVIINHQEKSFCKLFHLCDCIESISFIKFTRNNIKDMSHMFNGCKELKEINFFNFNTYNVTNMKYMFNECESLIKIDLSKFNTDKVVDMQYMFGSCKKLKELNISTFNTKNVKDMDCMF